MVINDPAVESMLAIAGRLYNTESVSLSDCQGLIMTKTPRHRSLTLVYINFSLAFTLHYITFTFTFTLTSLRYKIQDGFIAFSCIQLYTYKTLCTYKHTQ